MSESLPLRLTDDWVVAMRTFDVEKLAQITTPSFTFGTVDENKKVLEFSRTQYFQNLMEHVKQQYTGVDIRVARRSVKHAGSIEVIQEGDATEQPTGHIFTYHAQYRIEGDKISNLTLSAKANDFDQLHISDAV